MTTQVIVQTRHRSSSQMRSRSLGEADRGSLSERRGPRGLHRTAKLLELERRDAPLLRLHSLFPRGKERMALEAGRTRTADRLAQGSRVQRLGSSGSHILRANESILCGASVRKKARKRLRRPSTSRDKRRPFRGR